MVFAIAFCYSTPLNCCKYLYSESLVVLIYLRLFFFCILQFEGMLKVISYETPFLILFIYLVLGWNLSALYMLGKYSTKELYPQPPNPFLIKALTLNTWSHNFCLSIP
jgi:hypothetical protein